MKKLTMVIILACFIGMLTGCETLDAFNESLDRTNETLDKVNDASDTVDDIQN